MAVYELRMSTSRKKAFWCEGSFFVKSMMFSTFLILAVVITKCKQYISAGCVVCLYLIVSPVPASDNCECITSKLSPMFSQDA